MSSLAIVALGLKFGVESADVSLFFLLDLLIYFDLLLGYLTFADEQVFIPDLGFRVTSTLFDCLLEFIDVFIG